MIDSSKKSARGARLYSVYSGYLRLMLGLAVSGAVVMLVVGIDRPIAFMILLGALVAFILDRRHASRRCGPD